MAQIISKDEFLKFQKKWGDRVVEIGKLYLEKKEYKQAAIELVDSLYGYNEGTVLFKPTRAQHKEFRLTARSAVSYFIGHDNEYSEDTGFALQPWVKVRFVNSGFIFDSNYAITMGNYFFTDLEGREKKVEFTFGLFRSENGNLKINLHHSSIPYLHPKHGN
ncbi:hypothetical protein OU798_01855 [Prolixibacteraceae bacterium Z1-6]|uniref:Phosphoribosyl-AMP cyclohydrolase n=1 Tax=Draconibacterium aestuarii TaxID=2998507 RepID=A0A9X3J483_9BACT|nr:hypothetical protein [Prolixibacteraceae bacterium Z1-6]